MYSYWDEDPYFQVGLQGLLLKPPHSMFWNGSSHLSCFSLDIMELKTLKGLALHDILTEVHLFVHRGNWAGEEAQLWDGHREHKVFALEQKREEGD